MKVSIVYGPLRSGTTLLRLMLDGHPGLWMPGETDFLFDHWTEHPDGVRLDLDTLSRDRILRNSQAEAPTSQDVDLGVQQMTEQLAQGRPHLVLSLHRHIGRAIKCFPDAEIVRWQRDPRDVARSAVGMGWYGTPFYGTETWLTPEREWRAARPSIADERVLEVRYEELIAAPERHLSSIAEHLGLAYHEDMLAYPSSSTYGPVDGSRAYQWKSKMSPRDASLVEGAVGDLLEQAGYEPSAAGPATPGVLERFSQAIKHTAGKWSSNVKKFGIKDLLLVSAAFHFRMPGLARQAEERINAKLNSTVR